MKRHLSSCVCLICQNSRNIEMLRSTIIQMREILYKQSQQIQKLVSEELPPKKKARGPSASRATCSLENDSHETCKEKIYPVVETFRLNQRHF